LRTLLLLALAAPALTPAAAEAKGALAAWASRHYREDPKLLRQVGARALADTWKVSDELLKVERFFVDRPAAQALRRALARQVRIGGWSAAQVDAVGRVLVGSARAAYAELEPGLSPAARLEHRRRAAEILTVSPLAALRPAVRGGAR
jgi:hypothetical protein